MTFSFLLSLNFGLAFPHTSSSSICFKVCIKPVSYSRARRCIQHIHPTWHERVCQVSTFRIFLIHRDSIFLLCERSWVSSISSWAETSEASTVATAAVEGAEGAEGAAGTSEASLSTWKLKAILYHLVLWDGATMYKTTWISKHACATGVACGTCATCALELALEIMSRYSFRFVRSHVNTQSRPVKVGPVACHVPLWPARNKSNEIQWGEGAKGAKGHGLTPNWSSWTLARSLQHFRNLDVYPLLVRE